MKDRAVLPRGCINLRTAEIIPKTFCCCLPIACLCPHSTPLNAASRCSADPEVHFWGVHSLPAGCCRSELCTVSTGLWLPARVACGLRASGCASGPLHPSHPAEFAQRIRWKRLDLDQFLITSALIETVAAAATWSQ